MEHKDIENLASEQEEVLASEVEEVEVQPDEIQVDEVVQESAELDEDNGWKASVSEGVEFSDEDVVLEAEIEQEEPVEVENSELGAYEVAEIEEEEIIDESRKMAIVEGVLFSTDRPVSFDSIRQVFKGTNISKKEIREAIEEYGKSLEEDARGVTLEEVAGGFQLRTKSEYQEYLKRQVKGRPFRLSGPALEVIAILAYKQPCIKAEVDEIRGVESGHLMRALMDKSLIRFAGKSDLPGKPMLYQTTKRFLEIFGLKNLRDLPSLDEIDELIPEGIGAEEDEKEKLGDITDNLAVDGGATYSQGEDQLNKIADQIKDISTTTEFFELEKIRMREKRDHDRAQDIKEALLVGDAVEEKDQRWLDRYEKKMTEKEAQMAEEAAAVEGVEAEAEIVEPSESESEPVEALENTEIEEASNIEEPEAVVEEPKRMTAREDVSAEEDEEKDVIRISDLV